MSRELLKRVLVAVPGSLLLIALVFWGEQWGTALLVSVIMLASVFEYGTMVFRPPLREDYRMTLLMAAGAFLLGNILYPEMRAFFYAAWVLYGGTFFLFVARGVSSSEGDLRALAFDLGLFLTGAFYLSLPIFLLDVRAFSDGAHWVFLFLLVNWVGDSLAYFVGKRWGRRPLFRQISPKKTIEGAIAGFAGAALVAAMYHYFYPLAGLTALIVICLVIECFAQLGDLMESLFKRAFGQKDSGGLLPGHGGFLDRFDGVIFSAPVMYFCVKLIQ